MRSLYLLPLLACTLITPLAVPAAAADVLIYRCVAASGKLTLRDSPCAKGETQQVRSMLRPKDAAAGVAPAKPPAPPAVAPRREVQVVYRMPARPMYECVTAEGERYASDNGEGNPRWLPLWAAGYPAWSHRGGGNGHRPPRDRPDGGYRPPPQAGVLLPAGGTWVRDECHALPQEEVCSRLSDRRYEIIRRYNSALQSERRQLELEQRGIDARIDNDCGNP
ncbi:DUF4124 domain-containing protein [Pseudoxanthomonas gei]|uniref:DUF4124 domain-containing protein n=1 Tax=Pseudoxanthomonas gei TaxID=1383030 RepID=A0ABX0AI50_9GAMM|nr:DUF4124 domain-containing protein [Pseudoxanthomonas gei]NDK39795.1 DUF4124 domain-containing protein [Pseudoxanthomonas gei]